MTRSQTNFILNQAETLQHHNPLQVQPILDQELLKKLVQTTANTISKIITQ